MSTIPIKANIAYRPSDDSTFIGWFGGHTCERLVAEGFTWNKIFAGLRNYNNTIEERELRFGDYTEIPYGFIVQNIKHCLYIRLTDSGGQALTGGPIATATGTIVT